MGLGDNYNNGFYMPVAPAGSYGNGSGFFGGDWAWIILLLLIGGNGWGFGGFGGGMMWPMMMGGMGGWGGLDYLYPWLNNSQHISDGFRDQQISTTLSDTRTDINRGFADVQLGLAGVNQNICQTGNSITGAVRDGFYGAEIAANSRQTANMQQAFGLQNTVQMGFAGAAAGTADLKYTIADEACKDRAAFSAGIQTILDKLCQDKIDAKNETIAQLRQELLFARGQASQDVQTAALRAGQVAEVDALYNRLSNCPVPTVPVYGRQPIFTCNNNGCGSCNGAFGFNAA